MDKTTLSEDLKRRLMAAMKEELRRRMNMPADAHSMRRTRAEHGLKGWNLKQTALRFEKTSDGGTIGHKHGPKSAPMDRLREGCDQMYTGGGSNAIAQGDEIQNTP